MFTDIEVPTVDNIRNSELMGTILLNEDNVLCVGPTGTGKTLTVIGKLSKNMHKKFICDFFSFSARTTANQTQVRYCILPLRDLSKSYFCGYFSKTEPYSVSLRIRLSCNRAYRTRKMKCKLNGLYL